MTATVSFGDAAPHSRERGEIARLPPCGKTYSPDGMFSYEFGTVSFWIVLFQTFIHKYAADCVSANISSSNVSRGGNPLVTKYILRAMPAGFTTNRFQTFSPKNLCGDHPRIRGADLFKLSFKEIKSRVFTNESTA